MESKTSRCRHFLVSVMAIFVLTTVAAGAAKAAPAAPAQTLLSPWQMTGSLATARGGHTATLLPDGRVLVIGGSDRGYFFGRPLASAEIWDPASRSFSAAGTLREARATHTASLLPDGRVLVIGGDDGDRAFHSAEVWEPLAAAPEPG